MKAWSSLWLFDAAIQASYNTSPYPIEREMNFIPIHHIPNDIKRAFDNLIYSCDSPINKCTSKIEAWLAYLSSTHLPVTRNSHQQFVPRELNFSSRNVFNCSTASTSNILNRRLYVRPDCCANAVVNTRK